MDRTLQNVTDFGVFSRNQWVRAREDQYGRDFSVAKVAIATAIDALTELNKLHRLKTGQPLFTSIEGRPKTKESFFRKLHKRCCARVATLPFNERLVCDEYEQIYDIAGLRVACPYADQIVDTVQNHIRPGLSAFGIATDLTGRNGLGDKDLLGNGDDYGYRAYHFSIEVPAVVDIFGDTKPMICEVQARSELQNVWAAKSHDLLYKPSGGWHEPDEVVLSDMKAVSDSLNAADRYLAGIRKRLEKK